MVDSHVTVLQPLRSKADPRWINVLLQSHWGQRHLESHCYSGSTNQIELSRAELVSTEVPTPPIAEQERIGNILDGLDREIHAIEQTIEKFEHLRVGSIRAAMRDGLSLLMGAEASELASTHENVHGVWEMVPLGRLLTGIDAGHSPDLEDVPAGPGEWGVLKVSAIRKDGFHPEENKVARDRALKRSGLCIRPGDLLITRANTSQLVGLSCIVQDTPAGLMLSDKTLRVRVDERSTPVEFIDLVLGVAEVRRQIEIAATGTSGSMKNISQSAIKRLMIPWASPDVIAGIVRSNDAFEQRITALRLGVRKLRLLKQGLMDDLLTGRVLVPVGDGHRG
jgi:type I restriction enzyme S subunit